MEQILLLLNGPQQLQFGNDWIDEEFVSNHVVGIVALRKVVDKYTPDYVEKIAGVPMAQLQETVKNCWNDSFSAVYHPSRCLSVISVPLPAPARSIPSASRDKRLVNLVVRSSR